MGLALAVALAQTQENLNAQYVDATLQRLRAVPGWRAEDVERHFPGDFKPSRLVKGIAKLGAVADAATGILSVAQAVKRDRDQGDGLYRGTLRSIATSTMQISVGSFAGLAAGTLIAAGTASVAAPVIVGGLIGAGVGYGIGKFADWLSSW